MGTVTAFGAEKVRREGDGTEGWRECAGSVTAREGGTAGEGGGCRELQRVENRAAVLENVTLCAAVITRKEMVLKLTGIYAFILLIGGMFLVRSVV